jgi:hypothetical protein
MPWPKVEAKLERLGEHALTPTERASLVAAVRDLETIELGELTDLLRVARLP